MTAHVGTLSVDGTPISQADLARIEAEDKLHADQQRRAVRIVASLSTGTEDCRSLLAMLGLTDDVVAASRAEMTPTAPRAPRRRRTAA